MGYTEDTLLILSSIGLQGGSQGIPIANVARRRSHILTNAKTN